MLHFRLPTLSALLIILGAVGAYAQFSSPAFDPHCYFPDSKVPGQAVSYYGAEMDAHLGLGLLNIGPEPGDTTDRLLFAGLRPKPLLLTQQAIRQPFVLNESNPSIMQSMPAEPHTMLGVDWSMIATGHFHCKDRTDLLAVDQSQNYRIYWADEHGRYDSTRYSFLRHRYWDTLYADLESDPYVAYLTSDTVEDLVFGGGICYKLDSCNYTATLFKGGEHLYNQQPLQ